ncbi:MULTISPECIES: bifunctional serine/threonine-protein kinase/ABC transporter substrate-binding protein [unclassified Streptomyces]|uniref:bifunctional serine/threonine-protein kinase/ABC transporter substrate-binding protein n=1 Tax=unclassified Streptomyces TaxID=2593676 RepID=UPI0006F282CB|nr:MULTISPECIES: bifunctional serine/threonine-protein kinase/ABC transporter substrate-binding protein [unclassified Streptomyces]KQX59229.1 serine/threonine protein kinase [Streptomyces sp. Root1304]KRB00490.1 serine/threonine protein kinase [Streptomyces sp. Root66D1]
MKPLGKGDPSAVAGYRLLGRLGAGGMGVVYLARSAGGALAALKLIRAEHATDPGFRERFRREARAAERVTGRWVVRVLDAAPEAREPWLATEYVPGPSLAEAVGLHGALPEATVCALGARLASALAGMHAAGLVHRDVKPGNVLLALDGPRLIDFGIARTAGATALTATDAMIGTPGFLAPEQAGVAGSGDVGPAADVFSLGCVLAYALTGERPFGTGGVAAVVYRAVHEEPDLAEVPDTIRPLVEACLAKDPADRPTAAEVRDELGDAEGPAGDWLPDGLPTLIAHRSSRVLDLPVAEPTVLVPEEPPQGPSRRRMLTLGSAAAVAGTGGLAAWLMTRSPGTATGTGGPPRPLTTYTIGVQTDLSGARKDAGRGQERGVRLAVEAFNARAGRPFDLAVKVRDDAGDPRRAAAAAEAFGRDRSVLAVLGPTTPEVALTAAETYQRHALVYACVATGIEFERIPQVAHAPSYFEMRPPRDMLQLGFSTLAVVRGQRRVAVVEDRAAGTYAWYSAVSAQETFDGARVTVTRLRTAAGTEDFGPVVRAALAADAEGLFYAGLSPRRAGLCARELAAQGFKGLRGAVEYALEPEFLEVAGPAAEGWVFGTSYVDPALTPTAKDFTAAYRKRWGLSGAAPVDRYAAEAYDVVLAVAEAMARLVRDGLAVERGALTRRLRELTYRGVAKTYGFDRANVYRFTDQVYVHRIERGAPRFLGGYLKATRDDTAARKAREAAGT